MIPNYEQVRNFLLKNGLYNSLTILEKEIDNINISLQDNSHPQESPPPNQALNVSFGEESVPAKESSFQIESNFSTKNNFERNMESSLHASNTSIPNNSNQVGDALNSSFGKSNEPNPFDSAALLQHPKSVGIAEEKFSFAAENEEDVHEFDSFSKSHNNKFSKNENDEDANVFGNSFDAKLEVKSNNKDVKGTLSKCVLVEEELEDLKRPKSELGTQCQEFKESHHQIKSSDDECWYSDVRDKRNSHGLSESGRLSKKLFGDLNADVIFTPPTKTSLVGKKSNGSNFSRSSVFDFKLEFADDGLINSC